MNDPKEPAPGATGPSDFVTEAYALGDNQSIIAFYRKWAQDYDDLMLSQGYHSPEKIVALLARYLPDENCAVLDIGCGTGLTGSHVSKLGVKALDGIDISGEMIQAARARGIYRHLAVGDLNLPLAFDDDSFDAAVSSGTFTHGHVGPAPLVEIFRILKPGGLLACTVHFDLWHSLGFDAAFAAMMHSGEVHCLSVEEGSFYRDAAAEGWFCVYQKS